MRINIFRITLAGLLLILSSATLFAQTVIQSVPGSICVGQSKQFYYSGGCPMANLSWYLDPNGYTNGTITPAGTGMVNVVWNGATSNTTLIARCNSNPALTGATSGLVINALSGSPSFSISGPTTFCAGASAQYQATNVVNSGSSNTYTWMINGVTKQTSTSITFNTTELVQGSVVSASMISNKPCLSTTTANSSNTITIGALTNPPNVTVSITDPGPRCNFAGVTFIASPNNGGSNPTYKWYRYGGTWSDSSPPPEVTDNQTSGTNTYTPYYALQAGEKIRCTVISNAPCASSTPAKSNEVQIIVQAMVTPDISLGPDRYNLCQGESLTFSAGASHSVSGTINWSWQNGSGTGNSVTIPNFSPSHTVTVSATVVAGPGECLTTTYVSKSYSGSNITVSPKPTATAAGQTICSGQQTNITASASIANTVLSWSVIQTPGVNGGHGDQQLAPQTIKQTLINSTAANGTATYRITPIYGGCTGNHVDAVVTVKPLPVISTTPASQSICSGATTSVALASNIAGSTYSWTVVQAGTTGAAAGSGSSIVQTLYTSSTTNGTATYSILGASNGCTSVAPITIPITVKALPVASAANQSIPTGGTTSIAITNPNGVSGTTYTWTAAATNVTGASNGSGNTIAQTLTSTGANAKVVYTITPTGNGCTGVPITVTVTVQIPNNYNWIKETTVTVKDKKLEADVDAALIASEQKTIQWTYFDGIARAMQQIKVQGSPLARDVVEPMVYDNEGRAFRKYLPATVAETNGYFKPNTDILDGAGNYKGLALSFFPDARPFSETVFEFSPLDRPAKDFGPGATWFSGNKPVAYQTLPNVHNTAPTTMAGEKIVIWTISGGLPIRHLDQAINGNTGYYPSGALLIKITKNENGFDTREYTNNEGKLVLKKVQVAASLTSLNNNAQWALTYYVYDDFGNLRFVLQPELSKTVLASDTYNPSQTDLDNLAFQYRYDDERLRMTEKKAPGAGPVYMVYDERDRVVLTQDANQRQNPDGTTRTNKEWTFTKYDAFNRPVMTGKYVSNTARDVLQGDVKTHYASRAMYETYIAGGTGNVLGYNNNAFPLTTNVADYLTVTYYDGYDAIVVPSATYQYTVEAAPAVPGQDTNVPRIKGQVAGMLVKNLATGTWLRTVNYYDKKNRLIQTKADHPKGVVTTTKALDFMGNVLYAKRTYVVSSVTTYVLETFDYDHAGRLLWAKHSVNGSPEIVLVKNEYNERGLLVDKKLHSTVTTGADARQSVDYRYNIRGWLTSINNSQLSNDGGTTNNDLGDYFGMNLGYEANIGVGNAPSYNGDITGAMWSLYLGTGTVKENGYVYSYDPMSRLTGTVFKEKTTAWAVPTNSPYVEANITYDLNGNIRTLNRNDRRPSGTMDVLTYTYANSNASNRLAKVGDTGDKFKGYIDGTNTTDDYTFDPNGNLIKDENKGITTPIVYNHLNLPQTITRGSNTINYTYDATGRKLTQQVTTGAITKKIDYMGELVYENDALQFINHAEGRIATASTRLVYTHAAGSTTGLTAAGGAALSNVIQNGSEAYVKVTSGGATARAGVTIDGLFAVAAGERYKIRVKGYRDKGTATVSNPVYLSIKTNNIDLNWPGATLPASEQYGVTESWIEQIVTIPAAHTNMKVGITWNTAVVANEVFYINDMEIIKLVATGPEYQYHIKDHLGNIRVTFTTAAETEQSLATLETANAAAERAQFLYYDEAITINSPLFNHTNDVATGTVAVTGVAMSTSTLTLAPAQVGQLTSVVIPANATTQAVTWTSSNTAVATVNSSTGAVTAVAVGTATITATTTSGGFTATCAVTVSTGAGNIAVTGITVAPSSRTLTLGTNTTVQLGTTVAPANATNPAVTWASSNTAVATVNTAGLVTAVAAGSATITATSASNASATSTSAITVVASSSGLTPLIGLKFNENTGTTIANTGSLSASFTRTTPTPAWSTVVPATVGGASSIDFGTTANNFVVESGAVIDGLKSLTGFTLTGWLNCKSNVEGSGGNRIISWINNGGDGVDLVYKGDGSLQVGIDAWPDGSPAISTAGKVPTNASAPATNWVFFAVTYQSSTSQVQFYFGNNTADATFDVARTYAQGAVGTNTSRLAIGHFNLATRAGALDRMFRGLIDDIQIHNGVLNAAQIVAVQRNAPPAVAVTAVAVAPATPQLTLGAVTTVQLATTITPATATNPAVTWTSSNTAIATVNTAGLVTAVAAGTATITARSVSNNTITGTSTVTVNAAGGGAIKVTALSVSPASVTLTPGQTSQLNKTTSPANASNGNVAWISSNSAVATVSTNGLVTAVSIGTATITCTSLDGGFRFTTNVTVNNPAAATFYSTRLAGTPTERYGLAKSMAVMPGDVITAEVFVKYLDASSGNWTTALANFLASIANGTAPTGTFIDGGAAGSMGGGNFPVPPIDHSGETGTDPKAYLNYIVFSKNSPTTPVTIGYKRITTAAREYGQDAPHQRLAFEGAEQIVIKEPGFVYIYISNENGTPLEVYFDDFKVTHTKSPIIQRDDYYPYGLTFNSYQRENSLRNRYLYNAGAERQDDLGVDWDYTLYRTYDPALGAFMQVDPKVDDFYAWSPYNYGYDDPVQNNDPNGDCPVCGLVGAVAGGVIGGAIEAGVQLYKNGSVTDWKAVGGSALQGAVTGGAAGLTMGASLAVTTGTAVAANVAGGYLNKTTVQGKKTTTTDVLVNAAVGAGGAVVGKVVGKVVERGLDKLSNTAKGKLGETVTQIKYAAKGYKSTGKAEVQTGRLTTTGKPQVAKYDHAMEQRITGHRLTVESKYNTSGLTPNQRAAQGRVNTDGGLIVDRTTSEQLGQVVDATVRGAAGQKRQK